MYRPTFFKLLFVILSAVLFSTVNAQTKPGDTWTDAEGNQWELQGVATDTKQKADYNGSPSSQSSDFDGGWFFQAFKFIQWIIGRGSSEEQSPVLEYATSANQFMPAKRTGSFFSVGLGLGVSQKGQKSSFSGGSSKTTIWYLNIPAVKARYNMRMNDASTLFFDLTPYYAIALGGQSKFGGTTTSLKFGNSAGNNFKRGDFGIQLGAAYRWKTQPFYVGLVYDYGLANIYPSTSTGVKIHNRAFGIQVGRYFK